MSLLPRAAALALGVLTLASLGPAIEAIGATVTDDTGQKIRLKASPLRIVSIAPGATEMLFAAGAGHRLVATVDFSDEPVQARRVPRIGDSNAIDLERLLSLRPDLVVVWPQGNNPSQVARLQSLGIPLYRQQVDSLAQLPASIERLGEMAGTQQHARAAAEALSVRLENLERMYGSASRSRGKAVSVLLQVWDRPIYTVGGAHLLTDALHLCGARNVFEDLREAGPAVDVEAVVARDPDVIVAVGEAGTAASWLQNWRRFPSLRAVRNGRLIAFEDPRLTRLGPSIVTAIEALCKKIDAARPALNRGNY